MWGLGHVQGSVRGLQSRVWVCCIAELPTVLVCSFARPLSISIYL